MDPSRVLVRGGPEVLPAHGGGHDPAKAKRQLGWQPTTLFTALVDEMVAADVEAIKSGRDND